MPSARTLVRASAAVAALALVGTVSAQSPGDAALGLGTRIGLRLVVSLVVYLLLGGALVALGPQYATELSTEIREDPIAAFGWGLVMTILVPIVLVLLAFTIIGLVVTIPGILLLIPIGIVGTAVTVVTLGAVLGGERGEVSGKAALVGAVVLGLLAAIPILGNLITTVATMFGTGMVGKSLYVSWRG
ncbi:hypothetical protein [Halorarum halobium]|uniref:hypothetical protein n=1 Tax=Halorarum halobium TaxID=3075121 RepID=UPI0028AFF25F|nr:hypothetical protein [Halobaculum sp. XH14]